MSLHQVRCRSNGLGYLSEKRWHAVLSQKKTSGEVYLTDRISLEKGGIDKKNGAR
jgi:hypothetical protein